MVWEIPIHVCVQWNNVAPKRREKVWCDQPGNAVAAIYDDFKGAGQLNIVTNCRNIVLDNPLFAIGPRAFWETLVNNSVSQSLDRCFS